MKAVWAALLLLACVVSSAVAEPNDGTITGHVLNKTAGGAPTGTTSVLLLAFGRKEQAVVGQWTIQTDDRGRYSFSGLDRDANLVYLAVARYQDVSYPIEPFQLQDQATHESDIAVYEATTTDDTIAFERLNLLVLEAQDGLLQLMEMGTLVNRGDRTFITANPQDQALARAIKLALPSGALAVRMQHGFNDQDVIAGVGGVLLTSPVPPGTHEFALTFQLPYNGSSADISMQMPYPTSAYRVYVPTSGMSLSATGLSAGEQAQLGGQTYALYSGANLPRATMVRAQLSGLASTGGPGPTQLALISLGVVLFVIGGGLWFLGGRRGNRQAPLDLPSLDTEHLELVVRLAALDERFAAGQVGETEYTAERERGKQRLRELALARRDDPIPTHV